MAPWAGHAFGWSGVDGAGSVRSGTLRPTVSVDAANAIALAWDVGVEGKCAGVAPRDHELSGQIGFGMTGPAAHALTEAVSSSSAPLPSHVSSRMA